MDAYFRIAFDTARRVRDNRGTLSEVADHIRRVVERIKAIDATQDELSAERKDLERELHEIRKLVGAAPGSTKKRTRPWAANRVRPLRQGSFVWWAEKIISQRDAPISIDDLVKEVRHVTGIEVQKSSLVSNLSRYVRSGVIFTRPAEGFYSLREVDERDA